MILGICIAIITLSILLLTLFFLRIYLESKRDVKSFEQQEKTIKEDQLLTKEIPDEKIGEKVLWQILEAVIKDSPEAYDYATYYSRYFNDGKGDIGVIKEAFENYLKETANKEDSEVAHKHNHNRRKIKIKLSDVISIEDNDYIIRQDGRNVPVLQNINKFKQKKNGN